MSSQRSDETLWIIVEIRRQPFAIPAASVREIIAMPEITAIPKTGPQHRGVINLRGRILPLIDMRKQFGWQSVPEELDEFYKLMAQREQDHRNWLKALEKSVADGTEFGLARDPHKCAFGRWYDSYRSESAWIMALLRKFEAPHAKIHALASSVDDLTKAGSKAEASPLLENARNGVLREMISLFEQLRDLMRETVKELAMVVAIPQGTCAISVDSAVGVEHIASDQIKEMRTDASAAGWGQVHRVALRGSAGPLAMILEPEQFLGQQGALARAH